MPFDYQGARAAGYNDAEIASFLGQQAGFDTDGAIKSGYKPAEIIPFLADRMSQQSAAKEQPTVADAPAPQGDPMGTGFAETAQPPAPPEAGGGRGFVNPPAVGEKRDVGAAESFGRGFGEAGAKSAKYLAAAASALPVIAESAINAVKQPFGGKADYSWQDAAFRQLVDPAQNAVDYYALKPDEKMDMRSRIANGVGGLLQDLPAIIASGGLAEAPAALAKNPGMMEFVGNALSTGFDAMRPIILKAAGEKADQVLESGGSPRQAAVSALTAGLWAGVNGAVPMSMQGSRAVRAVTGFPVGAATGEAGRVIQNAADPDNLQQPFDPANTLVAGVQGSMLAAGMPGHADAPVDLRTPESARTAEADGIPAQTPHVADVGRVLEAQSVDDAIAAAKAAANPAPDDSIRSQMLAIRPLEEVPNVSRAPDVRPDIAGADGSGIPQPEGSVADRAGRDAEPVAPVAEGVDFRVAADEPVSRAGLDDAVEPAGQVAEAADSAVPPAKTADSELASISARRNDSGTVTVTGDPAAVGAMLRAHEIPFVPSAEGAVVGRSRAADAERVVQDFQPRVETVTTPDSPKAGESPTFGQRLDAALRERGIQVSRGERSFAGGEAGGRKITLQDMPEADFMARHGNTEEDVKTHEFAHTFWAGATGLPNFRDSRNTPLRKELTTASREFRPYVWENHKDHASRPDELLADGMAWWLKNPDRRAELPLVDKLMRSYDSGDLLRNFPDAESAVPAQAEPGKVVTVTTPKVQDNPFKTFLIRNGIALRLAKDFTPGTKERLAMGKTFRNGGLEFDSLAERAAEAGYIRSRDDTDALYDLVSRVASGERVTPMYGRDAETELGARMERQRQIEQDEAHARADLDRLLAEDADDGIPWENVTSNASEADAMRALGFTEQEIANAAAQRPESASARGERGAQPDEAAAREASGADRGAREEAHGEEGRDGLSRPTPDDVIAQQRRRQEGERAQAQRRADDEAKAKADAELPDFGLTGSDRAADANPDQNPLFRRSEREPAVGKRTQIHEIVSQLTRDWLRKPDIHVLGSMDEAPEPVRRVWEQQNSQGAVGDIEGFHWKGGVYLVGDALATKGDVQRVLFHEALGHFGLRGVFGDRLNGILGEVAAALPKEIARKAEQYGLDIANKRERLTAAEEVLAEMAQSRPEMGIVKRAVAAIRTFLREHGIDSLKMTRDEIIRNFLLPARGYVERGRNAEPSFAKPDGTPKFSRSSEQTFYSALQREVEGINAKAQGADGWRAQIQGLIAKGKVKADELEWSGLNDWLKLQSGKVTKEQIGAFLRENGVQVKEVTKGDLTEESRRDIEFHQRNVRFAQEKEDAAIKEALDFIEKSGASQLVLANANLAFRYDRPGMESPGLEKAYELLRKAAPEGYDFNKINDAQDEAQSARDHDSMAQSRVQNTSKYGQYVLPGGENYREVLLTLPGNGTERAAYLQGQVAQLREMARDNRHGDQAEIKSDIAAMEKELAGLGPVRDYKSSHWDEPNILAHIRLNDRTDADGKRVLFVEELQSDWAQDGRKHGFDNEAKFQDLIRRRDAAPDDSPQQEELQRQIDEMQRTSGKGVPSAPFVGKTDAWLSLALKRIIKMAADEGYDRVAFVNGEQSAERYDLSKQVNALHYDRNDDGTFNLSAEVKGGREPIERENLPLSEVENLVGKEIAKKMEAGEGEAHDSDEAESGEFRTLKGLDLKVGGDGMKSFYDKIVPTVAKDVLKKVGGEGLKTTAITSDKEGWHITPPDQTVSGKWMVKSRDYNSKGLLFDSEAEARAALAEKQGSSEQLAFDITDAMREKAEGGLPLFSRARAAESDAELPEEVRAPYAGPGAKMLHAAGELYTTMRNDLMMGVAPMSATNNKQAQAMAQNYANQTRWAQVQWGRLSRLLEKNFTAQARQRMWEAADEENVARIRERDEDGYTRPEGVGLGRLPAKEREAVDTLHEYGQSLWNAARDAEMVEGEGLPFWTPRMLVTIGEDGDIGKLRSLAGGPKMATDGTGKNITTNSSNLKHRKHLTVEETEAAASALAQEQGADGAKVVRDITVMPLAMYRLERAIAGRRLVNQLKEIGQASGEDLVRDGAADGFLTLPHPAFTTYRPRFTKNEDGKTVAVTDSEGNPVMDRVPLYIRKDFEGPLRAVMSTKDSSWYTGYMLLKSKAMSAIMVSPLIHNMVIWGKAIPASPVKMLTFQLYAKGHALARDNALMKEAVLNGMVPIGENHAQSVDVTDIAQNFKPLGRWGDPNESWLTLSIQKLGNLMQDGLGDRAKRGGDQVGEFLHHTLLWKQIGALQMGIYADAKARYMAKGFSEEAAGVQAAHLANRYGGVVAKENQSEWARKFANVLLFSRSFNFTNLGTIKDSWGAMPTGLKALLSEKAPGEATQAEWQQRRKAWAVISLDIALGVMATSMMQDFVDALKKDKGLDEIARGYLDRAKDMGANIAAHPLTPNSYNPYRLASTFGNEPGKKDRVDMGAAVGERHEYMRMPTGKVAEDLIGWTTDTLGTFERKMAPVPKALMESALGKTTIGMPVADPNGSIVKRIGEGVAHVMKAQLPWDDLTRVYDWMQGHATDLDKKKVMGTVTGFTFSQGHPGGPEAAVNQQTSDRFEQARRYTMQLVKGDLKRGDEDKARERMEEIGMTPREINHAIQQALEPKSGLSRQARQKFERRANDDEREEMERQRAR